jgi:hypothetical protein
MDLMINIYLCCQILIFTYFGLLTTFPFNSGIALAGFYSVTTIVQHAYAPNLSLCVELELVGNDECRLCNCGE